MEKEFVPYTEALALKELGFDELCFGWYQHKLIVGKEYNILEFENCKNMESWITGNHCSAPTFSQAFRWFREKYGLFHSITEYNKDGSLIIEISKDRVEIFRKMTNFDFTEYREVELECLKKLIEIVRQKLAKVKN